MVGVCVVVGGVGVGEECVGGIGGVGFGLWCDD